MRRTLILTSVSAFLLFVMLTHMTLNWAETVLVAILCAVVAALFAANLWFYCLTHDVFDRSRRETRDWL